MAKEKLLVVTERFFPEEFLINDLVIDFKKNYDVEVLTQFPSYPFDKIFSGYKNKLYSYDYYNEIKVHRVYTRLGYKKSIVKKILGYLIFAVLTWFKAFQLANNVDKVFFYHTGPVTLAHSAHIFKKIFKVDCYIWTQDIWPDAVFASGVKETKFRRKLLMLYLKRVYSNFNKVLVSCSGFIPIINQYYQKEIIHISQWSPANKNELKENILNGKMQFTFLGNLGSVQNLDKVCLGFQKAIEEGLNAQLNIVGDGIVFNDLKKIVENTKRKDIILWGRRPSDEMPKFINESNVMVISLKEDPLFSLYVPAKFQGYTAGGRPVLGILKGEVAEVIMDNDLGFTADPSDINSIVNGFKWFEDNVDKLIEMGNRSREYYDENYNRDKCISKILNEIKFKI